jgi:predicted 3-demethylubiquinone-9 3-methyltransferase (glyoxalase superfamily)
MQFAHKVRTCLFLEKGIEAAADFYISLLPDSRIDNVVRAGPDAPALVVEFTLGGAPYMALAGNPEPVSSHAVSISVLTGNQAETDRLWRALLADGGEEGRCGWLRDRYGINWQVVPEALPRLMNSERPGVARSVQAALMQMGRIDIARLEAAGSAARAEMPAEAT